MITRSLDPTSMSWSYDMHLQDLLSSDSIDTLPFGSVFGRVPPGATSKRHCHQDGEMFIALSGQATAVVGGRPHRLAPGDVAYIPPFTFHELRNDDDAEPFDLVSIYWEVPEDVAAAIERHAAAEDLPAEALVACPPPTPNGGLHLGHLAGPYLRADLYARGLRSRGRRAVLLTGTDDHQSYVGVAARQRGTEPEKLALEEGAGLVETFRRAGVQIDQWTRPRLTDGHEDAMRRLLLSAIDSEATERRSTETPYCTNCDVSLYEAFAQGRCPACAAGCDGEICEGCGRPNEAVQLGDLTCRLCGAAPVVREETALWLDLGRFAPELKRYGARLRGGNDLRGLADALLRDPAGLAPFRLTRRGGWGIAIGSEHGGEHDDEVLDPWAELCFTFLDAAAEAGAGQAQPPEVTLFLGYDNSYYYSILLPALAFATGAEAALPAAMVTNRFLLLDGAKFSTSRGHAEWADDALERAPADAVRAALLRAAPEGTETSIGTAECADLAGDPLFAAVQDWIAGHAALVEEVEGVVPGTGAWTLAHRELYRFLCLATRQADGLLLPDGFSARGYVRLLDAVVDRVRTFRETEADLRRNALFPEEARTSVALELLGSKALAALAWPVLPDLGQELHQALGLTGTPMREDPWTFLASGHRLPWPASAKRADAGGDA